MSVKRYELLNPFPYNYGSDTYFLEPSTEIIEGEHYYEIYQNDNRIWTLGKTFVENNPELFRLIPDETKEEFVWTDELVKEFVREFVRENFNRQTHNYLPAAIEQFKASKSNKQKIFSWDESTIIELLQFMDSHYYGTIPSDKSEIIEQFKEHKGSKSEEKKEIPFLDYLVMQKEKFVKEGDFETAVTWRTIERLYRAYQKETTEKFISVEDVVKEFVQSENKKWKFAEPTTESSKPNKDYKVELSKPTEDKRRVIEWSDEFETGRQDVIKDLEGRIESHLNWVRSMDGKTEGMAYSQEKREGIKLGYEECLIRIRTCKDKRKTINIWASTQTEDKSKEWVVLSVKSDYEGIHILDETPFDKQLRNTIESGKETSWSIHSVKRLSDNKVFSIGDEVWYKGEVEKIKRFYIYEDRNMCIETKSHGAHINLFSKPQPKERIIEVSHVTIPSGDEYYNFQIKGDMFSISNEKRELIKQAIEDIINKQ